LEENNNLTTSTAIASSITMNWKCLMKDGRRLSSEYEVKPFSMFGALLVNSTELRSV